MKAITAMANDDDRNDQAGDSAPVRPSSSVPATRSAGSCNDAREDDQRNAVADAARGDLLAEPHQEHGAADQRDDGGDTEEPARIGDDVGARFQADGNAVGLYGAKQHGAVAGVLVDDLAALLALFLELLERGT
jgi:hypothetical protein